MERSIVKHRKGATREQQSPLVYMVAMIIAVLMAIVAILLVFGGFPPTSNYVFAPSSDAPAAPPREATIPMNAASIGLPPVPSTSGE